MITRISKKVGLAVTASLMAVLIVFSCVMPAMVSAANVKTESVGGIVTYYATNEMKKFAYDLIDRTILAGLGKAASATRSDTVEKMINITRKILGGGQGIVNSKILDACAEILDACKEIQQQIAELDVTVRSVSSKTNSMVAELSKKVAENEYAEHHDKIRDFRDNYRSVIDTFNALNTALQQYLTDIQDPSVTESKLRDDYLNLSTAYGSVEAFYDSMSVSGSQGGSNINFESDLNNYLQEISPYYYDNELADDLSAPEGWGYRDDDAKTYLNYAHDYFVTGLVSENQMYDYMTSAIGNAAAPLINYLTAYQLYVKYKASVLNADPKYCEDEDSRQKALNDTWTIFDKSQRKAVRGVYQLSYLFQDELASMMRDYDVRQYMDLDYKGSEEHLVDKGLFNDTYKTLNAIASHSSDWFYIIKPIGKGSVYAVRSYYDNYPNFDDHFLVYDYLAEDFTMSQDFFNLQRTKDDGKDRGYKTIAGGNELGGRTEFVAEALYASAGVDELLLSIEIRRLPLARREQI